MFFLEGNFHYINLTLAAICIIHCIRKGNDSKWIWIVLFLPVLGSVLYCWFNIFSRRSLKKPVANLGAVFNPGARIKKLEENLRFSDTFQNKVLLADAYLDAGNTEQAIELYKSSLIGAFSENEHVLSQLVIAFTEQNQHEEAIRIAQKICKWPQFFRSKAHLAYALALEYSGKPDLAEAEYRAMKGRYSCFEHRFFYGQFLQRAARPEDAAQIFEEMIEEMQHLSSMEKKQSRLWLGRAREELKKIGG